MDGWGATSEARFGLRCWHGPPRLMERAHRHDDIEINFASCGNLTYLFGGSTLTVNAGGVAAFWAIKPHQLVAIGPGVTIYWLTVPLGLFLRWPLPSAIRARLLGGRPLLSSAAAPMPAVREHFARWEQDLAAAEADLRDIALLEIEARVRRLAHVELLEVPETVPLPPGPAQQPAARMAAFIATRFREDIRAEDVSAAVHLHPHYAMEVFRRFTGTTIGGYLSQCRVAEAQRLLITTDWSIAEVAAVAGFGSLSSFYRCFAELCDCAPAGYRRRHRMPR